MLWCFSGSKGNYDIVGGFRPIRTLILILRLISVQPPSCVRIFVTPWNAARQASLSFAISRSLLKLMFIDSVMLSNHLILCCALLLLPSNFHSIRVFSNKSTPCIKNQTPLQRVFITKERGKNITESQKESFCFPALYS